MTDSGGGRSAKRRITSERRALQAAVALAALLPIYGGGVGVLFGLETFGDAAVPRDMASHGRYLSGLLLGIGLAYWSTLPAIERRGDRFRLLTAIVFLGGLARLADIPEHGLPSAPLRAGLAMELVIAPALALWRERVERRWRA
jgi:hypothetical protein